MDRSERVIYDFLDGYRCSQAVLAAYAPDFDVDVDLARRISIALAGGSGAGGACGAVSGAYLVLGLKYGFAHPGDHERLGAVIDKAKTFSEKFKALHGELTCPGLIGLDVFSKEGFQTFTENQVKETRCARFVGDAVTILEEMMAE